MYTKMNKHPYFLMKEAISTSDATLIQYVYDRVSLKKGSKLETFVMMYLKPNANRVNRCMTLANEGNILLKDKLDIYNQCLQIAIHEEFKISLTPVRTWLESVDESQLLKYTKKNLKI